MGVFTNLCEGFPLGHSFQEGGYNFYTVRCMARFYQRGKGVFSGVHPGDLFCGRVLDAVKGYSCAVSGGIYQEGFICDGVDDVGLIKAFYQVDFSGSD